MERTSCGSAGGLCMGLTCSDLSVSLCKMGTVMSQAQKYLVKFYRVAGSSKEHKRLFKGKGKAMTDLLNPLGPAISCFASVCVAALRLSVTI